MTAEAFADLVRARRTGPGRWAARCPAHRDRSPSLSIASGRDGRIVLHCFAGCTNPAVVAALGLTLGDLFPGPPPTRAEQRKAREQREARDAEERRRARAGRRVADLYRRVTRVVDASGAALAYAPDAPGSDEMAATFHRAVRMQQEMETSLGSYGWVNGPPAKPCAWSPFAEPDGEAVEAGRVRTEAQFLHFLAAGKAEPKPEPTAQRPVSAGLERKCA